MSTELVHEPSGPPAVTAKRLPSADGKPKEVRGKAKQLLDRIVWQGERWQDAAHAVGMNVAAARKVLGRPHCVRYLNEQKQVFRTSASGQNIHRAVEIRDQDENRTAAIQAIKYLDGISEHEQNGAARHVTPGVVVHVNVQAREPQIDHLAVIEVNPMGDQEPVRNDE